MEALPDRIYFKDRQSRFIRVNQAMASFQQLPNPDAAIGKTDFDFFSKEHAQAAFDDEQIMMETGEPIIGKIEKETFANGPDRWASSTKVPMRDQTGKIIGTFGISRDVTAEHEAEERLAEYAAELAAKNSQLEKDMLMAREVQQAFLPQQYPSIPRNASPEESALKFCHRYLPTTLVGGDFFHIFALSDEEAGVLICDVMGHGVFAALITAVQRVLAEELEPEAHDPGAFLGELNRRLLSVLKRTQMPILVTAFYLTVNAVTGKVRFANAGHPKPLIFRMRTGSVASISNHSAPPSAGNSNGASLSREVDPALGLLEHAHYTTHEALLESGDTIVLYTDGIYDVDREDGKYLTEDTLPGYLLPIAKQRGEVLLDSIVAEIEKFAMGSPFSDDVCVVGIELARKPESDKGMESRLQPLQARH